ncbi:polyketide synthase [Astrocystis sublimbata]|nr:polyketide synthase [Astrocystis sublimbata]
MDEPIAIIGLDARLPGDGDTPERFYELLLGGRSALTEVPQDRYKVDSFWHPDPNRRGTTRVRHGHFLKGSIAAFDAPFFSITPKEASSMDPQQRGMLECVYRALENAGIPLEVAAGTQTGVYVGCFSSDYRSIMEKDLDQDLKYAATGNVVSMLSNRVSWFYDLRGPSLTIDTACSSSLVALHQACNSLKLKETSMAIVGGCNLILSNEFGMTLDKGGVLGPDGICRSFDEKGNGYGRGEGFGVVVLKRVSDAIKDRDTIRAVIRNTGSNQDGRSPGITQPTATAQVDLIRRVYSQAGLDMSSTRFFEAHGTGTSIGDPIEASAIGELFGPLRSKEEPLVVGALKSNVGHLEGASGVAAVIKGVFTLEQGIIPANAWLEKLNPKIKDSWHLQFPTKALLWPQPGLRRMSINSFGVGGSNAHAVFDDALHFLKSSNLKARHRTVLDPEPRCSTPPLLANGDIHDDDFVLVEGSHSNGVAHKWDAGENGVAYTKEHSTTSSNRLFVWSSHDQDGVLRVRDSLNEYMNKQSVILGSPTKENDLLRDLNYTLAKKRTHHGWRSFAIADSASNLRDALALKPVATRTLTEPRLAFIFTGQGAQWAEMGRELMELSVFRSSIRDAEEYLQDIGCPWLLQVEITQPSHLSRVNEAEFSQPLCTALQIALVDLLFSWGIYPHAIAGHSSGEIAAAYAAGYISRESALKIAYYRGQLCTKLAPSSSETPTGMAAVTLTTEQLVSRIRLINDRSAEGTLEIACLNSPDSHTVSGDLGKIDALVDMLKSENIFARKLNVEMAYHSRHMRPIYDEYVSLIESAEPGSKPYSHEVQFFSSTRNAEISASELQDPSYWADNLVSPVRFSEAVTQLLTKSKSTEQSLPNGITDILEIGPHNALHGPLRTILKSHEKGDSIKLHTVLKRGACAATTALTAAGSLWARGYRVDLLATNSSWLEVGRAAMLTDLPSYPFNHSSEYWFESRISRNTRFPRHPRHELLGAPSPDWNKHNALWRHRISVSENPWLADHKVFDDILYPAAGMLAMAIEASRQLADLDKSLEGFKFSDVSFHQALKVPGEGGVESHFYLRPCNSADTLRGLGWSEFQLFTLAEEDWIEHCRGYIRIEYEEKGRDTTRGFYTPLQTMTPNGVSDGHNRMRTVSKRQVYATFKKYGNVFGPQFQTLEEVRVSKRSSAAQVKVRNPTQRIKAAMPYQHLQEHIVHPASLDGIIQANLVPLMCDTQKSSTAFVPFYAKDLWVSAKSLDIDDSYKVSAEAKSRGPVKAESTFTATSTNTGCIMAKGSGFVLSAIRGDNADFAKPSQHIAFHMDWKPDVSMIEPSSIVEGAVDHTGPVYSLLAYESLALDYMRRALDLEIAADELKMAMPDHRQRYLAYMKHAVETTSIKPVAYDVQKLQQSPEGALIIAVGEALPKILTGEVDPLEVIFNGKLADNFYQRAFGAERCFAQLSRYLDVLVHKNPAMNFLEIGAGTGGATKSIMEALTRSQTRFKEYCFTDISPAFFEVARGLFGDHLSRMSYKVLNIEKDITEQGFEPAQYDVVIAANVLHATRNMKVTLRNTRQLLKPGGKLILYECTNPNALNVNLVFGTLPGWWLSQEPHREFGPLMTRGIWGEYLQSTGFTGLDAVFPDFPDPKDQFGSIMVATAVGPSEEEPREPQPALVIKAAGSDAQSEVASQLASSYRLEAPCEVVEFERICDKGFLKSTCILVTDLGSPILRYPSEEVLASLKHIIRRSNRLLWLSRDGDNNPDYELLAGFARVIRAEHPGLELTTISFDDVDDVDDVQAVVAKSLEVLRKSYSGSENTFRVVKGVVHIARIVPAIPISKHVQAQTESLEAVKREFGMETFHGDLCPLSLQIGSLSQLDTLQFADEPAIKRSADSRDVDFKVMATGTSFRDLALVLGQLNDDIELGVGAAGIVMWAEDESKFVPGDRVMGLSTSGTIKTCVHTRDDFLVKIPDAMSWAEAASIPFAASAAYAVLVDRLHIESEGDTILIHSAAGAFGQAAVQLAQRHGFEIFVTAGTQEKQNFLHGEYGIAHDHIFSSRDTLFKEGVRRLTQARGVDVVLNCLSGEELVASWECVAPFGTFVELGLKGLSDHPTGVPSLRRNIRFEQFDFEYLIKNNLPRAANIFQRAVKKVLANWRPRRTSTITYPFSQVQDAFRCMQSRQVIGRVVLEPRDNDIVSIVPRSDTASRLNHDFTYVIVGGLGGLGQAIARWVVERGARHLILLSRSGPTNPTAKAFLDEMTPACENVATPVCDVTDKQALEICIAECLTYMPKIKGCIQASMVLKDNRFLDMSLDEWNSAIRPKVDASWNLHQVLGNELDFFVLLSSTMGIVGNKEQSNYAAGNTFMDSLARYRVSQGLPGVSLNLPAIEDVGFVADKPELLESMRADGNGSMPVKELLAVLDYHCGFSIGSIGGDTHLRHIEKEEAQVILRPGIPHEIAALGVAQPPWMRDPLFTQLGQLEGSVASASSGVAVKKEARYASLITAATSMHEVEAIVLDALLQKLSRVLSISTDDLELDKPLHAYGVDSLVAVDVRSWLLKDLGSEISVFDMNSQASIRRLAKMATEKNRFLSGFKKESEQGEVLRF